MTVHLKVSDLKFHVLEAGKHWQPLENELVEFGRVVCISGDRAGPRDYEKITVLSFHSRF